MKKLTQILSELSSATKPTIIGQGSDPWDYAYDKTSDTWFARKKNSDIWVDLSKKLSDQNYAQAKKVLDDRLTNGTSGSNMEKWQRVVNVPDTRTAEFKKAYKTILDIAGELLDITTNNPGYYFSTFAGKINDDESGAAKWFANYYNTTMGPKLDKIQLLNNTILNQNIKNINNIATGFVDLIVKGKSANITLPITDPNTKKTTNFKMFWDYM